MRKYQQDARKIWKLGNSITTIERKDGSILKRDRFILPDDQFYRVLEIAAQHEVPRPSSWSTITDKVITLPKAHYSYSRPFMDVGIAGGWQEAIIPGTFKGTAYRYDLRSAYLWAAMQNLPDPRTYRRSVYPWRDEHGVYVIEQSPRAGLPFPLNHDKYVLVSAEELSILNIDIVNVIDGVTWDSYLDTSKLAGEIQCSCGEYWKAAARSFWGRWGMTRKLVMETSNGKIVEYPNRDLNLVWAHLIVSRVRTRVWQATRYPLHVYVDSVITPECLDTGDSIGDWRLEQVYEKGITILGPGQFGPVNGLPDKLAGVARHDPRRLQQIS